MGTRAEIRATALTLPADERAALAHDLIASLDEGENPQAEALWAAEIERRAGDVAGGSIELIDADEVHSELTDRLKSRTGK